MLEERLVELVAVGLLHDGVRERGFFGEQPVEEELGQGDVDVEAEVGRVGGGNQEREGGEREEFDVVEE